MTENLCHSVRKRNSCSRDNPLSKTPLLVFPQGQTTLISAASSFDDGRQLHLDNGAEGRRQWLRTDSGMVWYAAAGSGRSGEGYVFAPASPTRTPRPSPPRTDPFLTDESGRVCLRQLLKLELLGLLRPAPTRSAPIESGGVCQHISINFG